MEVKIANYEAMALIKLETMLRQAGTPIPQFLHWVADRLTLVYGDPEQVDYIQTLRERAKQLHEISLHLGIERGPERTP